MQMGIVTKQVEKFANTFIYIQREREREKFSNTIDRIVLLPLSSLEFQTFVEATHATNHIGKKKVGTIGRIECIAWATSKLPYMVEHTEYFMWITPTLCPLLHCNPFLYMNNINW